MKVHLPQTGYRATVDITRPANATAYTAGDVIGVADVNVAANAGSAIHTLTNIGPAGGHIVITAVSLRMDVSSVPAGMTSYALELYDGSPAAILDNAAQQLAVADRGLYLGKIDIGSPAVKGVTPTTLYVRASQLNEQFQLATGSTSMYALLVTNGGFTPASGCVFRLRVHALALD